MNKGFTLIEMLGIITVLAVVLLVTFPSINNSLKQAKENTINNSMNNIKLSTEAYIELNYERYEELNTIGGKVSIKVKDLYDANLLKGKQDGVEQDDTITIERNNDSTYSYYYKGKEI